MDTSTEVNVTHSKNFAAGVVLNNSRCYTQTGLKYTGREISFIEVQAIIERSKKLWTNVFRDTEIDVVKTLVKSEDVFPIRNGEMIPAFSEHITYISMFLNSGTDLATVNLNDYSFVHYNVVQVETPPSEEEMKLLADCASGLGGIPFIDACTTVTILPYTWELLVDTIGRGKIHTLPDLIGRGLFADHVRRAIPTLIQPIVVHVAGKVFPVPGLPSKPNTYFMTALDVPMANAEVPHGATVKVFLVMIES